MKMKNVNSATIRFYSLFMSVLIFCFTVTGVNAADTAILGNSALPAWSQADGPLPQVYLPNGKTLTKNEVIRLIRAALSRPDMGGISAGMKAVELDSGKVLAEHLAGELFTPASNQKILTTAAAFDYLGPWYTFTTPIKSETPIPFDGILKSNLYVCGSGDPWLVDEQLYRMASELKSKGLTKVEGDLVVVNNFFDARQYGPGFGNGASGRAYAAAQTDLSANFNAVSIKIMPGTEGQPPRVKISPETTYIEIKNTSVTGGKRQNIRVDSQLFGTKTRIAVSGRIPASDEELEVFRKVQDPSLFFGHLLLDKMKQLGITTTGKIRMLKSEPQGLSILHKFESLPLAFLIDLTNKYSNNFMAEMILRTIGACVKGKPGTWDKGASAVKDFLVNKVGLSEHHFKIDNGSGMGENNKVSASAIVAVLAYMWKNEKAGPEFVSSLSIGGRDGTMEKWRIGNQMQALLRAKTGTLNSTVSLSGYVKNRNGKTIAFAILFNNCSGKNLDRLRVIEEEICRILADYRD